MESNRQPPVRYIDRTRAQYEALGYATYDWAHNPEAPTMASLSRPLSDLRLGLIATGGIYAEAQTAFTFKDDVTYRAIPSDTPTATLRATHFAYDLEPAQNDPNVVFPIDTMRGLVADGTVGAVADDLLTFMGGIYSTRRVTEELIPTIVDEVAAMEVDLVLLVPV